MFILQIYVNDIWLEYMEKCEKEKSQDYINTQKLFE